MEIIAELLLQAVGFVLELFGEVLLQVVVELVAEVTGHLITPVNRRRAPPHPALAVPGYLLLGALAGAVSLWLRPALFIRTPWLQVANLLLTPLCAGLVMGLIGRWRRGRDKEVIRIESFAYGFAFAAAMSLVRFVWGR